MKKGRNKKVSEESVHEPSTAHEVPAAARRGSEISTHLSMADKERIVWQRANSRCENCQSYYALQIEHDFPKALGGTDELENLKLLCRSCNQRRAVEMYGVGKMQNYLDPVRF